MKLRLKENPREWRKSVWLTVLGLALLCSLLRWRKVLSNQAWLAVLGALLIVAILAWVTPRLFRGYYRVSMRVGFASSQVVARVVLLVMFVIVLTPLALVFRLMGKDSLRLRRLKGANSYWSTCKDTSSLDRMF